MSKRQEQWMEVGRRFAAHETAGVGLCHTMKIVAGHSEHYDLLDIAKWKIKRPHHHDWWCARTKGNDYLRATFAYLMAAMTDSERDAIVEGL